MIYLEGKLIVLRKTLLSFTGILKTNVLLNTFVFYTFRFILYNVTSIVTLTIKCKQRRRSMDKQQRGIQVIRIWLGVTMLIHGVMKVTSLEDTLAFLLVLVCQAFSCMV